MKAENQIDKIFNEKLGSIEKTPPGDIWVSLSSRLKQENRKAFFILARNIAAGLALLLTIGLSWYFISGRYETRDYIVAEKGLVDEFKTQEGITENFTEKKESSSIYTEEPKAESHEASQKKFAKEDALNQRFEDDHPPSTTSTIAHLKTHEVIPPAFSIISSFPEQISPPAPGKDRIMRKKSKPPLNWDVLFSDHLEEKHKVRNENRQWQLSAMAAPEYSYRTVKDGVMASSAFFNNSENARLTYSGGFQLAYQLSDKLNFQSGIVYSRSGIEINNLNTRGSFAIAEYFGNSSGSQPISAINIGNSMGLITPTNSNFSYLSYNYSEESSFRNSKELSDQISAGQNILNQIDADLIQYFDFIELPMNLRYRIFDGKINLSILGGLSSNILIGNKVVFISEGQKLENGSTEGIRTFNYSGNLGFSIDYELSQQFLLLFEPRYKHYLNSVNREGLIDARPYMFGVFTGVRYRF